MYAGHTERLHEVITTMDAIIKRYFFIEPLKLTIIHDEMIKIKWFFLSNFKFKKRIQMIEVLFQSRIMYGETHISFILMNVILDKKIQIFMKPCQVRISEEKTIGFV